MKTEMGVKVLLHLGESEWQAVPLAAQVLFGEKDLLSAGPLPEGLQLRKPEARNFSRSPGWVQELTLGPSSAALPAC